MVLGAVTAFVGGVLACSSSSSGGSGGDGSGSGGAVVSCPTYEEVNGLMGAMTRPCTTFNADCEYVRGTNLYVSQQGNGFACGKLVYECKGAVDNMSDAGVWTSAGLDQCLQPQMCPAMRALIIAGGACTQPTTCGYIDGRCDCLSNGDGGFAWSCNSPNPGAGCPAQRPLLGTSCTGPIGAICNYGPSCSNKHDIMTCDHGSWQVAYSPCL